MLSLARGQILLVVGEGGDDDQHPLNRMGWRHPGAVQLAQ